MARPLRIEAAGWHRQTKGAETDRPCLGALNICSLLYRCFPAPNDADTRSVTTAVGKLWQNPTSPAGFRLLTVSI